ncbi:DUF1254 domain-containing protein [Algoriphagus lutimaris]|uniref:DUF1214 domain-containing protein n=1 Tax=Algoriphagus lutimaris TaxID=613197 RepID=UPI00196B6242|nr:DUF1214 domain-containing protein [Algoriphagus lutimaris]MBN3521066.1 DUF1254 domain-containing protein [Algoriphagus lutimaris]
MKTLITVLFAFSISIFLVGCENQTEKTGELKVDEQGYVILTDAEVENLIKRSYQYVAMYNVNNKFALAESGMSTRGYNKGLKNTQLLDHTVKAIARPNNDVMYQMAMLDLRKDAAVFEFPAMESKYVSLMATAYDHYVNVPLTTTEGDFKEPTTILFYTQRTENYDGSPVEGVDEIFEMTGDFVSVVLRVMPHANEPEKFQRIIDQINQIKGMTLSEFQGQPKLPEEPIEFPDYGATDADIFEHNLLEVMQFIFNHTTFDTTKILDKGVLDAYKPLGIEPGKTYDPETAFRIDGKRFREKSIQIKEEFLAKMNNPEESKSLLPKLFQLKGNMTLEPMVLQSVVGPIGLPLKEAVYPPVVTSDGAPMNAMNDYVIEMSKEDIPPATAFWSLTLYDTENGFFIPNDHKKYSVGENSGMQLNPDGGIKIYISEKKPDDIPMDNWLPINRIDQNIDVILRVYAPDLEKYTTWTPPKAVKVEN